MPSFTVNVAKIQNNYAMTEMPGIQYDTTGYYRKHLWWDDQIGDYYVTGNGIDDNYMWTYGQAYVIPMRMPQGVPNAFAGTAIGGGSLTGLYRGVVVWRNSSYDVQSNQSNQSSVVVTTGTHLIRWSITGVTPPAWADKWRIYRSFAGDYSNFYYVGEESIATTTYDDNTADAALGSAVPTVNGEMPRCSVGKVCNNRLFCASGNTLYWSEIGAPASYDVATGSMDVGNTDITGLAVLFDVLYVFNQETIWELSGTSGDVNGWVLRNLDTGVGCGAHHSIQNCENLLYFWSSHQRAVYTFNGQTVSNISDKIYYGHFDSLPEATFIDNWSTYNPKKRWYTIFVCPSGGITRSRAYIYNIPLNVWYVVNYNREMSYGYTGEVVEVQETWAGSGDGKLYKLFDGTDFAGAAISSYVKTKQFDCDVPTAFKKFVNPTIIQSAGHSGGYLLNFNMYLDGSAVGVYAVDRGLAVSTKKISTCVDRRGYYGQLKLSAPNASYLLDINRILVPFKMKGEV